MGYWIDEALAGNGYMPGAFVLTARYAFDELHFHRIQISIIPRNHRSRRVVEKLKIRDEGVALRYLEINGVWETTSVTPSPPRSGPTARRAGGRVAERPGGGEPRILVPAVVAVVALSLGGVLADEP